MPDVFESVDVPPLFFPNPPHHIPITTDSPRPTQRVPCHRRALMTSNLKSETARINGAKSKGPITPDGKARSSTNARRHGLASAPILLPGESKEDFQQLLADYMDQFHPRTPVETDLVETMAISRWRLRRLLTFEASLFDEEMQERDKSAAWVFQKFADHSSTLTVLLRYEGHLNRSFDKALKQLLILRSKLPNEPREPRPQEAIAPKPTPLPPAPSPLSASNTGPPTAWSTSPAPRFAINESADSTNPPNRAPDPD